MRGSGQEIGMEREKLFMSIIAGPIRMEALEEGTNMTIIIVIRPIIMTGYSVSSSFHCLKLAPILV